MKKLYSLQKANLHALLLSFVSIAMLACQSQSLQRNIIPSNLRGASAGINAVNMLVNINGKHSSRNAALLGTFVAEYLSRAVMAPFGSALSGVIAQKTLARQQEINQKPDYALLQNFQDQLHVNITELLNRSTEREMKLNTYMSTLTKSANEAKNRQASMNVLAQELADKQAAQQKVRNQLENEMNAAMNQKDFVVAGEKQTLLTQADTELTTAKAKTKEVQNIVKSLEELLKAYGIRYLAIEKNRTLLLSGQQAVDIPGADINVIQHYNSNGQAASSRERSGIGRFNSLFDTSLDGL